MTSSLDDEIAQMEQNLQHRKLALKVRSRQVVSTTCDKLSSPAVLYFAAGTGFLIGKLSDRPKKKTSPKQKKSKTSAVLKVLRIFTSVQTATSFAKHL